MNICLKIFDGYSTVFDGKFSIYPLIRSDKNYTFAKKMIIGVIEDVVEEYELPIHIASHEKIENHIKFLIRVFGKGDKSSNHCLYLGLKDEGFISLYLE